MSLLLNMVNLPAFSDKAPAKLTDALVPRNHRQPGSTPRR